MDASVIPTAGYRLCRATVGREASTLDANCTKSPGSARTISAVTPVTQRCLDGQPLRDAVAAPRLHVVPATRVYLKYPAAAEASTAWREQLALTLQNLATDIMIGERKAYFGGVHAVGYERGQRTGAADPRRDGDGA
ncbi:MAG: gamma-glutamyltransferase [Candidatus Didemnitutus sp.]|nr:gamma-glutamyltransferase [Candidatus Didemnitutus sp.]